VACLARLALVGCGMVFAGSLAAQGILTGLTLVPNTGIAGSELFVRGQVAAGSLGVRIFWNDGRTAQGLVEQGVDAQGFYSVRVVVPEDAQPGLATVHALPVGSIGLDLVSAGFTVLPTPPGAVSGQIRSGGRLNLPVSGAEVRLLDVQGMPSGSVITDALGNYSFRDVRPGPYTVLVRKDGLYFGETAVSVAPGSASAGLVVVAEPNPTPAPAVVSFVGAIALPLGAVESSYPVLVSDQQSAKSTGLLATFPCLPPSSVPVYVRFWAEVQFPSGAASGDRQVVFEVIDSQGKTFMKTTKSQLNLVYPAEPVLNFPAYTSNPGLLDWNVSAFPPGDLTLRVTPYEAGAAGSGRVYTIRMRDLNHRWFNNWVRPILNPTTQRPVRVISGFGKLTYILNAELPNPPATLPLPDINLEIVTFHNQVGVRVPQLQETFTTPVTGFGAKLSPGAIKANLKADVKLLGKNVINQSLPFKPILNKAGSVDQYRIDSTPLAQKNLGKYTLWRHPLATGIQKVEVPIPPCCVPGIPCDCWQEIAAGWDLYVDLTLAVGADLAAKILSDLALTMNLTPYVSAKVGGHFLAKAGAFGVGCKAEAHVSGTAKVHLPVNYQSAPTGNVYFDGPCVSVVAEVNGSVSCVPGLNGSKNFGPWYWPGECVAAAQLSAAGEPASFVPSIYIDNAPAVAANGIGQALMIWAQDDGPEGGLAQPYVYYRFFNGQTWELPRRVTTTPALVVDPKLAFVAPDRAVAVWAQNKVTPAQILTGQPTSLTAQEIWCSIWTGSGWSAAQAITDDAIGDCNPVIAADPSSGQVMAAWFRAGEDVSVSQVYSLFDGRSWSRPQPITVSSNWIDCQLELQFDRAGRAWAVWVRDQDGNLTTHNDRQLMIARWERGSWTAPERIPNHPEGAFAPAIAADQNGQPLVVFTVAPLDPSGQRTSGVGNRSTLWTAYQRSGSWTIAPIGRSTYAEAPVIAINRDNQALVMFRRFSDDTLEHADGDLALAVADLNGRSLEWSQDFLTHDNQTNWKIAFAIDEHSAESFVVNVKLPAVQRPLEARPLTASPLGSVSLVPVTAQPDGSVLAQMRFPDQMDLSIQPEGIQFSNPHPGNGETLTVTATVRNTGFKAVAPSTRFTVKFYDGPWQRGEAPFAQQTVAAALPFGASVAIPASYTVRQAGLRDITVVVDAENGVPETDESNNTATSVLGRVPEPQDLMAFADDSTGRIHTSWAASAMAEPALYFIYRTTASGRDYELVGSTLETSFADRLAHPRILYYYAVVARDSSGVLSVPSNEARAGLGLETEDAPALQIHYRSPQIVLSWPSSAEGFTLQETGTLRESSSSWHNVITPPARVGDHNQVILPAPPTSRFYRLMRP
jgi:hypothetical protein